MSDYSRVVKTQAELDQAIADGVSVVEIRSDKGVWIKVWACGGSTVWAYGGSTVTAYDGSTVWAYVGSTVTAYGGSTVRAYDGSTVWAYGGSTVTAYDGSTVTAYVGSTVTAYDGSTVTAYVGSTVTAYGGSTVRAYDGSTVWAYGGSTVTAYDGSTVTAYVGSTVTARGGSTVWAYGGSTVWAYDGSTVTARDGSTVTAGSRVAVHLHSGRASIAGGVIIDHTKEPASAAEWCAWHDVPVTDGIATLYKAVNDSWTTDRGVDYSPGATPEAPDWEPDGECGGGLHFSPTPVQASAYFMSATRCVEVGVRVDELSPILGDTAKAKAKRVVVGCREVTIDMIPVDGEVVAS